MRLTVFSKFVSSELVFTHLKILLYEPLPRLEMMVISSRLFVLISFFLGATFFQASYCTISEPVIMVIGE